MPWQRLGECPPERCQGRCCEHIGVLYSDKPDALPFLKLLQTRGVRVVGDGVNFLAEVPQRCQHLTAGGLCSLHPSMHQKPGAPRRPDLCEEWPTEPWHLTLDPYCGFSFEWVDEGVLP